MKFWLYRKILFQKKIFMEPATLFSLFGITLGVAFLVVSMAGFSGFTRSLKESIIDVTGDISVLKRGSRIEDHQQLADRFREISPHVTEVLGFVRAEVLVAHKGKLTSVFLQGVDWNQARNLAEIQKRTLQQFSGKEQPVGSPAYLGKVVAETLGLQPGDSFKVILPKVSKTTATEVEPKVQTYFVEAILDFGKYEFNQRVVLTAMNQVQELLEIGDRINGFRLRLSDSDLAAQEAEKLQDELGWDYTVRDWSMTNRSLFKAIKYEKRVLFFVMMIMVVAAFFNVSTTLFLGVLKRYSQISVLRALGLKKRDIIALFCLHGLSLGVVGLILGILTGLVLCFGFENLQQIYPIMPEEVYKLSNFTVKLEWKDLGWVVVATLVTCFLSTLAPAIRGAQLSPVEGLKYE